MAEAHALGIVHRDLKPANLFLCGSGKARVIKVLDFGVSKLLQNDATGLTASEVVLGTPVYMAPEQIEFAKRVDARADIWSMGVILYEMLACELPFKGTNATGLISSIMRDTPKPLRDRRPDTPEGLALAMKKALAKEADDRFPSMVDFAEALLPFGPKAAWRPPEPDKGAPPLVAASPSLSKLKMQELAAAVEPINEPGPSAEPPPLPDQPQPRAVGRGVRLASILVAIVLFGLVVFYFVTRGQR
jgi:serine/threonine-protein kinase